MFFIFYVSFDGKPVAGFMERQGADAAYLELCRQANGRVRVSLYACPPNSNKPILVVSNM